MQTASGKKWGLLALVLGILAFWGCPCTVGFAYFLIELLDFCGETVALFVLSFSTVLALGSPILAVCAIVFSRFQRKSQATVSALIGEILGWSTLAFVVVFVLFGIVGYAISSVFSSPH